MTDYSADARHGVSDVVKILDIILTDAEWALLVDAISDRNQERQRDGHQ